MSNEIWARIPGDVFDEFIRYISHEGTKQAETTYNRIFKLIDTKVKRKQMTESEAIIIIENIINYSQYVKDINLTEDKIKFDKNFDTILKNVLSTI